FGGGVYVYTDVATLQHVTIASNTGTGQGGGLAMRGNTLDLTNSILAGNSASVGADVQRLAGTIAARQSLFQTAPAAGAPHGTTATLTGLAPLRGSLKSTSGGTTKPMPLLAASPATDAGDDGTRGPVTPDQPGKPRQSGAHVDMGAYETRTIVVTSLT